MSSLLNPPKMPYFILLHHLSVRMNVAFAWSISSGIMIVIQNVIGLCPIEKSRQKFAQDLLQINQGVMYDYYQHKNCHIGKKIDDR